MYVPKVRVLYKHNTYQQRTEENKITFFNNMTLDFENVQSCNLQLDDTLRSLRVRPLQSNTSYSFSLTFFCSLFPVYQFFQYSNKITDSNRDI